MGDPATGVHPRACGGKHDGRRTLIGVHPRACGGNDAAAGPFAAVHPRACGGNPMAIRRRSPKPSKRVHPRACGGNDMASGTALSRGSIPARAGETGLPRAGRPSIAGDGFPAAEVRVHPRACGGNGIPTALRSPRVRGICLPSGPSPRVRGKRVIAVRGRALHRSIPARAGETYTSASPSTLTTVHPRACGGNGPTNRSAGTKLRSIPARAGETSRWGSIRASWGVHPCGGNPQPASLGPSPRVRGKRVPPGARPPGRQGRVHPRACGGNCSLKGAMPLIRGPSPRVRGKRDPAASLQAAQVQGPSPRVRGKRSSLTR